jgi:transketolase
MTISMRDQMGETIADLFAHDQRFALLLADISTSLFKDLLRQYPQRAYNLGILEQTLIGVAAGMALEGYIPIVHSIVPFLVERPFEQLKDDFCYQRLAGNFISTGASYDYSTEGMTHHGSGDVQILRSLPGMQIVVPGTAREFDTLFRAACSNDSPTYYRMAASVNPADQTVNFGKLTVVRRGSQATLIAVGPMLGHVLEAASDMDVTILYCTTIAPFDAETLRANSQSSNIVLVEPYYEGVLVPDIVAALKHTPVRIEAIGVPHQVLSHYGTPAQHDQSIGLTAQAVRSRIERFLSAQNTFVPSAGS